MTLSPNEKFEILEHSTSDDSYFYSDTDYEWYVIAVATGDQLFEYYGHSYGRRSGEDKEGVKNISFSETSEELIVTNFNGKTEVIQLPKDVYITDKGHSIKIIWADGKEEKRKRNSIIFTTKYGQPYNPRKLKNPPKKNGIT